MTCIKKVNPSDPASIPKFVDELPKPAIAKPKYCSGQPRREYYELQMMAAEHRFHKRFPLSTIWDITDSILGQPSRLQKTKPSMLNIKTNYRTNIFFTSRCHPSCR